MKQLTIKIGDQQLPCRLSMGAMLLFKRTTGKDVSEMSGNDMEELLILLWCCVVCACKADGIGFDTDFDTFVCQISPSDLAEWSASLSSDDESKKKAPQETVKK